MLSLLLCGLAVSSKVVAAPLADAGPVVQLSYGSFQGNLSGNIVTFLGIPYAAPPVGNLRFALPQAPLGFNGVQQATSFGAGCPQIISSNTTTSTNVSEDCLFINVVAPASIPSGEKLPVIFWINGGAFSTGDTSNTPGDPIVRRSIDLDEPIVYVSTNYRLNAFGFLGGQEMQAAGVANLGLQDQRFAMSWVQQYISEFGGDPSRVIISGESAGAMSVGFHMVVNNGNTGGLFHGAFMSSGSPYSIKNVASGQSVFNQVANFTGCATATDSLSCLRTVPFTTLMLSLAENLSGVTWAPMVDGTFLKLNSWQAINDGLYAKIPFVTGDVDDEGTRFALTLQEITTDAEFKAVVADSFLIGATQDQINAVLEAYPQNATEGSPFGTGEKNAMTPEFKRLASFEGDFLFQMPRRYFLQAASKTQDTWAFLYKRGKSTPDLGSYHTIDVPAIYGSADQNDYILTDAFINFANNLNPTHPSNGISLLSTSNIEWNTWSSSESSPPLLTLLDTSPNVTITPDTYRQDPIALLTNITLSLLMISLDSNDTGAGTIASGAMLTTSSRQAISNLPLGFLILAFYIMEAPDYVPRHRSSVVLASENCFDKDDAS